MVFVDGDLEKMASQMDVALWRYKLMDWDWMDDLWAGQGIEHLTKCL